MRGFSCVVLHLQAVRYGRCVASRFGAVTISKEVHALVPWNTSNSTSEWSARLVPRVQDPYVAEDPWQFRVSAASKGPYTMQYHTIANNTMQYHGMPSKHMWKKIRCS